MASTPAAEKPASAPESKIEDETKKDVSKEKESSSKSNEADPRAPRTLFIGNLPLATKAQAIKRIANPFGKIENVRIRGVVPETPGIPKRAALHSGRLHPGVDTISAYVVFADPDGEEAVTKACEGLNMTVFKDKHLRVTPASKTKSSPRHTVFVGNLPFDVSEETFLNAFQTATQDSGFSIVSARLVRDKKTGIGRGIGFVSFDDELGVRYCRQLEKVEVAGRTVRITAVDKKMLSGAKNVKREKKWQRNPKFSRKRRRATS